MARGAAILWVAGAGESQLEVDVPCLCKGHTHRGECRGGEEPCSQRPGAVNVVCFYFFIVRVGERCRERCGGKEGQAVQRGELHLRRPASFRLSETY